MSTTPDQWKERLRKAWGGTELADSRLVAVSGPGRVETNQPDLNFAGHRLPMNAPRAMPAPIADAT